MGNRSIFILQDPGLVIAEVLRNTLTDTLRRSRQPTPIHWGKKTWPNWRREKRELRKALERARKIELAQQNKR